MPTIDYVKRPKIDYTKPPKVQHYRTLMASIQGNGGTYRLWQIGHGPVIVTLQCGDDQPENLAFPNAMPYPRALRVVAWAISSI